MSDINFSLGDEFNIGEDVSISQLDSIPTQDIFQNDQNEGRFAKPLALKEFNESLKDRIPSNTKNANNFAVNLYSTYPILPVQGRGCVSNP